MTYFSAAPSCVGLEALNASLSFSGMTTSLTSGLPRRETCWNLPLAPFFCVVVQMPMTGFFFAFWFLATHRWGTWSATDWTLKPASVSSPDSERSPP